MRRQLGWLAACLALLLATTREASACGCFTTSIVTSSTPVIQAGERILFHVKDGQTTAYIQIQYRGRADDFGWLVPLPSVPKLEVGADPLFSALQARTDPSFSLTRQSGCRPSSSPGLGCGGSAAAGAGGCVSDSDCGNDPTIPCRAGSCVYIGPSSADLGAATPLVVADTIGPYDYAVLKADSAEAMLAWLAQNRYVVPAGTMESVAPYVHPGAYFLALKLRAGLDAGDVQPIVVHYASDLPMIPITLTSVGATPHMGILVWVLGSARAIPRNYHHTVLDLAAYDWTAARSSYDDLVVRAVGEAPGHHTFVTEYAGPSSVMWGALPGEAGIDRSQLDTLRDPAVYVARALSMFGVSGTLTGTLQAVLRAHIPEPPELLAEGLKGDAFYRELARWLAYWARSYPRAAPLDFDPVATTDELVSRVARPLAEAAALFHQFPYLTRLHTALSPEEMTSDPVFSWNASLPPVPNQHRATLITDCDGRATLTPSEGPTSVPYDASGPRYRLDAVPASLTIEALREQGPPQLETDNRAAISSFFRAAAAAGGCRLRAGPSARGTLLLAALALLSMSLRRRR